MIHTQNKVMADKWHAHKLALEAHYATKPVPSNNYEGTSKDALGTLKSDRSMNHKRVTTAGKQETPRAVPPVAATQTSSGLRIPTLKTPASPPSRCCGRS